MRKNQHFTYLTNKSMNGGFNLTKKQSRRRSNLLSKKQRDLITSLKRSRKAWSKKLRSGRKCSGGLKAKDSISRIPKLQPLPKHFQASVQRMTRQYRIALLKLLDSRSEEHTS